MPCSNGYYFSGTRIPSLPKRRSALVDWRTMIARYRARLVPVMTRHECLRRTTFLDIFLHRRFCLAVFSLLEQIRGPFVHALIFDVPLSHLPHEQELVVLIVGPAHVKEPRRRLSPRDLPHQILLAMVRVSPRKFVGIQDLDPQPEQRALLRQQGDERLLVAFGGQDDVPEVEERDEEVAGAFVVAHVIEAGVGGVGGVAQGSGAVVLEEHVVVEGGGSGEEREGVAVPDDVDVLEEDVVAEVVDQLDAGHFGEHHGREGAVSVTRGFLLGHVGEYRLIVKDMQSQTLGNVHGGHVGSKHQNISKIESLGLGMAHEVHEKGGLSHIGRQDHDGITRSIRLSQHAMQYFFETFGHVVERFEIGPQILPMILNIFHLGRMKPVVAVRHLSPRHVLKRRKSGAALPFPAFVHPHPPRHVMAFVLSQQHGTFLLPRLRLAHGHHVHHVATFRCVLRSEQRRQRSLALPALLGRGLPLPRPLRRHGRVAVVNHQPLRVAGTRARGVAGPAVVEFRQKLRLPHAAEAANVAHLRVVQDLQRVGARSDGRVRPSLLRRRGSGGSRGRVRRND
mmetsp:Transcript_26900/g.61932  ORF Transcript_26900/g.61932 Transcript_26900/m.61932 type:complete len:565 (+) Transcript_26900:92-1786(+)